MIKQNFCIVTIALVLPFVTIAQDTPAHDWLTWGGGPDRSGWAQAETDISPESVSKLGLKWKVQLDIVPRFEVLSTSTAPLVVDDVPTPQGSKNWFSWWPTMTPFTLSMRPREV
jgi:hypothetical protein